MSIDSANYMDGFEWFVLKHLTRGGIERVVVSLWFVVGAQILRQAYARSENGWLGSLRRTWLGRDAASC